MFRAPQQLLRPSVIRRLLSSSPADDSKSSAMAASLTAALKAAAVKVTDVSGGCGSMYRIEVTSEMFKGVTKVCFVAREREIKREIERKRAAATTLGCLKEGRVSLVPSRYCLRSALAAANDYSSRPFFLSLLLHHHPFNLAAPPSSRFFVSSPLRVQVKQHRMVQDVLKKEIGAMHGLTVVTNTP